VPVIDLDAQTQTTSSRVLRWNPRFLIMATAVLMLFSLPGESASSRPPFGATTLCENLATSGETAGSRIAEAIVLDVESGEVLQTFHYPAQQC